MEETPHVIRVIESQVRRGCGVTYCAESHVHEPIRIVTQYHTLEGGFVAEHDPISREQRFAEIVSAAQSVAERFTGSDLLTASAVARLRRALIQAGFKEKT